MAKMTVLEPSPHSSAGSAHQKSLTEEEIMELLSEDESNDGNGKVSRGDGKNGKVDQKKPDLVEEIGGAGVENIGLDEAFVEGSPNIHDDVTQEISEQLVDGAAGNSIVSDDSGRASDDKPTVMNRADNFQRGIVGLMNIGNTCFMNAGLQCLLNTPALVEFFGTRSYSAIPKVTNPKFKLLRCFFWIFNKAWGYGTPNGMINLSQFKEILGNCHSDFKGSGQHDCQEFLALLLDTLDDQLRVLHSMEQQTKVSEDDTRKIDERKENVRPEGHDEVNNSKGKFGNHNGVVSETVKQELGPSSPLQNGHSRSAPLRTVPNRKNLKWKGEKLDMKIKEKYILTLPRSRLFSLPDFGAVKVKSPLFEEVGGYNEENNYDSSSWDSLARKGHSLYTSPKSELKERPPAKRIRLSEADDTSETGTRRKLDFEMRGLRITDEDDHHRDEYYGMQEVPVLVSETVKHAVSAVVRSEVTIHPATKDKKVEPTFSVVAEIHDNSREKPNDNQTVITKAFEGIMTSTITCSQCSHSSSVNEPFIYLTLRIPQNTTRDLRINFVSLYNCPSNRREEYTVSVPLYWTVRNIKEHAADSIKSEEHRGRMIRVEDLYVTYVWDHAIMEFLSDDLPVGHINETKDIYVYEVNSDFDTEEPLEMSEREGLVGDYEEGDPTYLDDEHKFFRSAQPKRSRNSYKKEKTYDCAVCWKSPPCLRMNLECECVLCEDCLQKSVEVFPRLSERRYKCPHCTETVSFSSLVEWRNSIEPLPFRVVFMNGQYPRSRSCFGYPYVIRFPTAVQGETLYGYIRALLEPQVPFDLISLPNRDGGCASCSHLYCQGCELSRFGTVHLKPGSIIGVCYKNLPDSYVKARNVPDMATESSVHNVPHYTYEPSFNIDECLEEFSRVEKLDSDWFCAQCKKTREASKSLAITRCPDYLIIHLSRFQFEHNMSHKLDNQIKFNGLLDLSSFVSESCRDKENVKYELYGCVCHSGSASYGHYTAYVKNPLTQEWIYCNDSVVSKEDPDSTIYSSVYVLFYSREGIKLDPGLEFVRRSSTTKSPAIGLVSPVRNSDVHHNSSSNIGLSRRKRPQVMSTSPTTDKNNRSEAKVPRRNLSPEEREFTSRIASERDSPLAAVSPIETFPRYDLKREILMDWDLDETQMIKDVSSYRDGSGPAAVDEAVEEEKCEHFIGRDDHLPYYRGYNPSSSTNGNVTFTIDPDLLSATASSSKHS